MNGISTQMAVANAEKSQLVDKRSSTKSSWCWCFSFSWLAARFPYPMLPYFGAMAPAIGAEIVDFLQGNETAEKALEDVEAAYIAAATEKAFFDQYLKRTGGFYPSVSVKKQFFSKTYQ